jgi:hypothetical protein
VDLAAVRAWFSRLAGEGREWEGTGLADRHGMLGRIALVVVVVSVVAGACRSAGPPHAPQFNVLPRGELHSAMWQLVGFTAELDRLLRQPSDAIDRAKVERMLVGMERAAAALSDDHLRAAHPLLEQNADEFLLDVRAARLAADQEPPNYYLAGVVSGGCVYCHHPEGGIQPVGAPP